MTDLDVPYTRLSNEILDALSHTNLSPYEWRFLMVLFRKTYGHQKKEDWIAINQVAKLTGMRMSHVSRAKSKLIAKNIVTQTGNKLSFNKYHTQWRELPKQVTVTQTGNNQKSDTQTGIKLIPKQVSNDTHSGNSVIPKQGYTKESITKEESLQKKGLLKKDVLTPEQIEPIFAEVVTREQWATSDYVEKVWRMQRELNTENREEFYRKARILINSSKHPTTLKLAHKLYVEMAQMVNDGMFAERSVSDKSILKKRETAIQDNITEEEF